MMTGYGLQLYHCVEEALNHVSRKRLMSVMLDLVKQSDSNFESVFNEDAVFMAEILSETQ